MMVQPWITRGDTPWDEQLHQYIEERAGRGLPGVKGDPGADGGSDAVTANRVANGPLTKAALSDSIAAAETRRGGKTGDEGDSISLGNSDPANNLQGGTHGTYFAAAMGGRAEMVYNDSIGGTNSVQMRARMPGNLLSRKVSKVRIMAGTNDVDPIAQTLPSIEQMIKDVRAANAEPILHTIPPHGMKPISAPTGLSVTSAVGSGGTLAAATYLYRVTSTTADSAGNTTGSQVPGETTPTSPVSVTTTGSTSSVVLDWNRTQGSGYKVYRSANGGATYGLVGTVTSGARCGFRDTGAGSPGATPPSSNTTGAPTPSAAVVLKDATVNNIVHHLARKYGCELIDYFQLLADPAGGYKVGYCGEGIHPTELAQRDMGNLAAQKTTQYRGGLPYLAGSNTDPTNLYNNGLFLNGGTTRPTGWGPYGGATGAETNLPDAGIIGNAYQIANLNSSVDNWYNESPPIAVGFAPGDKIAFSYMAKVTGLDLNGGVLSIRVLDNGSGTPTQVLPALSITQVPNGGDWFPFYGEGYVRAGATQLSVQFSTAGRGVTAALAQLTIRNLTALGLAS